MNVLLRAAPNLRRVISRNKSTIIKPASLLSHNIDNKFNDDDYDRIQERILQVYYNHYSCYLL